MKQPAGPEAEVAPEQVKALWLCTVKKPTPGVVPVLKKKEYLVLVFCWIPKAAVTAQFRDCTMEASP